MALAWSTIALLVLLLPGFGFLIGLTSSENFSRETAPKNPLAQLAILVCVSFLVHGLLYGLLTGCSGRAYCIRTDHVLAAFQLAGADRVPLAVLGESIRESRWYILGYVVLSGSAGGLAGYAAGFGIVRDWPLLRNFAQHRWVFELNPDRRRRKWAFACVVSDLAGAGTYVMYQGLLVDFGLASDGRFSYLVIRKPYRRSLQVAGDGARTHPPYPIGGSGNVRDEGGDSGPHFLVVDGSQVKNLFFAPYEIEPQGVDRLDDALRESTGAPAAGIATAPEMFEPAGDDDAPAEAGPPAGREGATHTSSRMRSWLRSLWRIGTQRSD